MTATLRRSGTDLDFGTARRDDLAGGLTAFSAMWGLAALFSIGGDYSALSLGKGLLIGVSSWAIVLLSLWLIRKPRNTAVLLTLAAVVVVLYALRAPVASSNKTITMVMDVAILISAGYFFIRSGGRRIDREAFYEQIRVVARALLAIMYFYGIFHKINLDFLNPDVSCAVGLYSPLAGPFGLADNIYGKYLAIYVTFVAEGIAMVALYWRRYFAVGLLVALAFHFVIPISGFSWYMDFSSLVFALYLLSVPRAVSAAAHTTVASAFVPLRAWLAPYERECAGVLLVLLSVAFVLALGTLHGDRSGAMIRQSVGIVLWTILGGVAMIVLAKAALRYLPYDGDASPRQPAWLFVVPAVFFLSCLSPYIGLKTESSINMFSNLHTEGGQTNHLLFRTPPYIFGYQDDVVRILDASGGRMLNRVRDGQGVVLFALVDYLRQHPDTWVSYELNGQTYERMTTADFADRQPGWIVRNLLPFKLVNFQTPKVCTH